MESIGTPFLSWTFFASNWQTSNATLPDRHRSGIRLFLKTVHKCVWPAYREKKVSRGPLNFFLPSELENSIFCIEKVLKPIFFFKADDLELLPVLLTFPEADEIPISYFTSEKQEVNIPVFTLSKKVYIIKRYRLWKSAKYNIFENKKYFLKKKYIFILYNR